MIADRRNLSIRECGSVIIAFRKKPERWPMQLIKKYANRKLYHTNRKQYITLEGIAALIQAGESVQVLDNETGDDITASILTQVVLFFFFNDTATTEIYTLSLHDALPI